MGGIVYPNIPKHVWTTGSNPYRANIDLCWTNRDRPIKCASACINLTRIYRTCWDREEVGTAPLPSSGRIGILIIFVGEFHRIANPSPTSSINNGVRSL